MLTAHRSQFSEIWYPNTSVTTESVSHWCWQEAEWAEEMADGRGRGAPVLVLHQFYSHFNWWTLYSFPLIYSVSVSQWATERDRQWTEVGVYTAFALYLDPHYNVTCYIEAWLYCVLQRFSEVFKYISYGLQSLMTYAVARDLVWGV